MELGTGGNRGGWSGTILRGAAILALLGAAACQQNGGQSSEGGMFGSKGRSEANAAPAVNQQRALPSAPAPTPAAPAAPPAAPAVSGTAALGMTPDGQDRRVRVSNQSGQVITLIRGSASNDNNWGQDRIPTSTLGPGSTVIIDFNDNNGQCSYDLQATLEDGTVREQRNVNICQVADWIIATDGTVAR